MQNKALALATTALLLAVTTGTAQANKQKAYTDYARVVHVEPLYKVVTVREPQRHCEWIQPQRHHNARNQNRNHNRNHNRNNRRNERYFTSGQSFGQTGLRVNVSNDRHNRNNSRGADISFTYTDSNHHKNKHKKHRRNNHIRANNGNRHGHGHNRQRGYEHCVTRTVSRNVRRQDGYNVTYVYRGNTFYTKTDHHPGRQIRVRVDVRPH